MKRNSWDTALKHITRHGLLNDLLTHQQIALIPRSNISRWKNESQQKYLFCELNQVIQQEIQLIKKLNQSSKTKAILEDYFQLCETFHTILVKVKNIKSLIRVHKEQVVNSIEKAKKNIPLEKALKVFNISRATFENYKTLVIHTCHPSYFKWCVKRFANQLLIKEVLVIQKYMNHNLYKNWSKASVYLKAVRDQNLKCSLSTFYKYCRLLGFKNKPLKKKTAFYNPVKTSHPNQLWCADVTVFKTVGNLKYYLHFLMDHYSKKILGYQIQNKPCAKVIKQMLEQALKKYRPDKVLFLTDGGSENVNTLVSKFINQPNIPIAHIIAQKDVCFSNAMVEALNKVIKHQFLYPQNISSGKALEKALDPVVIDYNTQRPQWALGGNTPEETFTGMPIDFSRFSVHFKEQKALRITQNKQNRCLQCQ